MNDPWLSIVGLVEDNAANLPPATRALLDGADVIFGGPRHLDIVGADQRGRPWPIPFSVEPVLQCRGKQVVVLASGDPFWHGVGGSLMAHLQPDEWRAMPAPSTFSLAASKLGWRLEETTCHGLHAAPFARLRGVLVPQGRLICLVRDGAAPAALAEWLCGQGAGQAQLHVLEQLGSRNERIRHVRAEEYDLNDVAAPVAVAVELPDDVGLSRASGLPDDLFEHDGQITKRPVRALTLSALAPRKGELLWDIGSGSGSVSVEWCLAGGRSIAFERHRQRAKNIQRNADDFGVGHLLTLIQGSVPDVLAEQLVPDCVFIGGGGKAALFDALFIRLPSGTRLVANAVTLETEALLTSLCAKRGGNLLRIELAQAAPLGNMTGWNAARPVVQWSVTL